MNANKVIAEHLVLQFEIHLYEPLPGPITASKHASVIGPGSGLWRWISKGQRIETKCSAMTLFAFIIISE